MTEIVNKGKNVKWHTRNTTSNSSYTITSVCLILVSSRAYTVCMLFEPALYCGLFRQPSASEPSPHKYHKVSWKEKTRVQFLQKLGIKGCDADIIEVSTSLQSNLCAWHKHWVGQLSISVIVHLQNLVEVIRDQQLSEWSGEHSPVIGTLQDDCKQYLLLLTTLTCFAYTCKCWWYDNVVEQH